MENARQGFLFPKERILLGGAGGEETGLPWLGRRQGRGGSQEEALEGGSSPQETPFAPRLVRPPRHPFCEERLSHLAGQGNLLLDPPGLPGGKRKTRFPARGLDPPEKSPPPPGGVILEGISLPVPPGHPGPPGKGVEPDLGEKGEGFRGPVPLQGPGKPRRRTQGLGLRPQEPSPPWSPGSPGHRSPRLRALDGCLAGAGGMAGGEGDVQGR